MRHMQALLIFLNITVIYISRLNIGVAVVAMTNAETTNPDFEVFKKTFLFLIFFFFHKFFVILSGIRLDK